MATYGFETGVDQYAQRRAAEPELTPPAFEVSGATKGWTCLAPIQPQPDLSPRERQILGLVSAGKTRKEVAYELGVTHSTVRVLYSRAMKKLGGRWQPVR
jgi:DNA-binding NarL/FixJ family response regulator